MTLLKVLIVAFTIGSANLGNDDGALGGKRPSQFDSIVENIVVLLSSLISTYPIVLKWRRNRGVTICRPPPAGPMLPINMISMIDRKVSSRRSYQPPWSNHCRRISIGGCAPYVSLTWLDGLDLTKLTRDVPRLKGQLLRTWQCWPRLPFVSIRMH